MKFHKNHWAFLSLLILGLAVRLVFMSEQGLSNDELSGWYRTRFSTWNSFWNDGVKVGDMHPAFYQIFLWIWVRIFGDSEFSLRATSLLFYCLNSFLIYKICCNYFTKLGGLLLQALYVGLTFTVINTVFARPYNSGVFFIFLAFLSILNLKTLTSKRWLWTMILAFCLLGAMLSHYFAFITVLVVGLCALFYVGKQNLKYLFIAGVIAVIGFLPHLEITSYQINRGGLGWLAAPKLNWPVEFIHEFFNESWWLFILLLTVYLIVIFKYGKGKWTAEYTFSLSVVTVTFIFAFVLSHLFTPILRDLVMLFILPFLLIPLFSLVEVKSTIISAFLVLIVAFVPLADSLFRNQLLEPVHYGVFKEIGDLVNSANDKYGKESITYASNFNNIDYLNFYVKDDLKETIIDWENQESFYQLAERVRKSKTPYFCYSVSNKFHIPMFLEVIKRSFPTEISSFKTKYSAYFLYQKNVKRTLSKSFFHSQKIDTSYLQNEFINEAKIKVGDLPKCANRWEYYLIECKGAIQDSVPVFFVATVERDGVMLMNGELPAMYAAYDQTRLLELKKEQVFYLAFDLPESLLPSDVLKIYCWNPNKGNVKMKNYFFYLIKD